MPVITYDDTPVNIVFNLYWENIMLSEIHIILTRQEKFSNATKF